MYRIMNIEITSQEEKRYEELQQMALGFARTGETNQLRKMIEAGMPVNLSDPKGQTLLMLASYNGHTKTTAMLLEAGADPDRRNDRGQTPLAGVSFKGYPEIAELLNEYGADMNADSGGGMAPIHFAAMFGRYEVVKILETYGASLHRKNNKTRFRIMPLLARWIGNVRSLFRSK